MTKHNDPTKTAAEFLQYWQEQIAKQMSDPATIHAMLAAMQTFAQGNPNDATSSRPAPAPHAYDDAIKRLSRRIDGLEHALERISAKLDAAKNPAGKGVRRAATAKPAVKRSGSRVAKTVAKKPRARKK